MLTAKELLLLASRGAQSSFFSCWRPQAWPSPWGDAPSSRFSLWKLLEKRELTWDVRHGVELLHHFVWNDDGLPLHGLTVGVVPLRISVLDGFYQVITHSGVDDVEEVISWREPALRKLIREVAHESHVLLQLRPKIAHWELIELRDIHHLDCVHGDELLFPWDDLPQEILVAHQFWRAVELALKQKVRWERFTYLLREEVQEIILAWELVGNLSG